MDIKYYNSKIKVRKNQVYESELLKRNGVYLQLLQFTQNNDKTVENSHDVVSHWMIKINQYSSETFMKNKKDELVVVHCAFGIGRSFIRCFFLIYLIVQYI